MNQVWFSGRSEVMVSSTSRSSSWLFLLYADGNVAKLRRVRRIELDGNGRFRAKAVRSSTTEMGGMRTL